MAVEAFSVILEMEKIDRLCQLNSALDKIIGAEKILNNQNGRPFVAEEMNSSGEVEHKEVDRTVVQIMKGITKGLYTESVSLGNKEAAEQIIFNKIGSREERQNGK